ncbi:MAG: hypothetical protein DRR19_17870 [Candidatus Parabeggiatoa sp. nov. 1]|nr:MAG: hypothetical protein DRR19_17870 [Gammaproteobacteria bacterium]
MTKDDYNKLTETIISAAIEVHKEFGPGLLESVYEVCLVAELRKRRLHTENQVRLPVHYKGERLDKDFSVDVLVEQCDTFS